MNETINTLEAAARHALTTHHSRALVLEFEGQALCRQKTGGETPQAGSNPVYALVG